MAFSQSFEAFCAGVSIHWTGSLDWTTGLDNWNDYYAHAHVTSHSVIVNVFYLTPTQSLFLSYTNTVS